MPMTMTEADAVTKLIHFVVSGELYTGQEATARAAARNLDYLGERAGKVLKVTPAGDLETYAARLAPLAAGADAAPVDERTRREMTRRVMRILDFGKTGSDPELTDMTVGQIADRLIAVVQGASHG